MMPFDVHGNRENPTLVCVPGLLGGPADFSNFIGDWAQIFHVIVLDPDRGRWQGGPRALSPEEMEAGLYNSSAEKIDEILVHLGIPSVFLMGVSLGGKIIYDFATKFPSKFLSAVVIDVGPGPFEQTDLFRFIDGMVEHLDLTLPFADLKLQLREQIPDRNLRSMIQTQIFYPGGKPPARWKAGMGNFGRIFVNLLKAQDINEQFESLEAVDEYLANTGRYIYVLRATRLTGVCATTLPKMAQLKSLKTTVIDDASHFMHVTHKERVGRAVARLHPRFKETETSIQIS